MLGLLIEAFYFFGIPVAFFGFSYFCITQDRKTKLMLERERAHAALEQRRLLEEDRRQAADDTIKAVRAIGNVRKDQKEKVSDKLQMDHPSEPIEATDPFAIQTAQHSLPVDPVSVPEDATLHAMDVFVTNDDHTHA